MKIFIVAAAAWAAGALLGYFVARLAYKHLRKRLRTLRQERNPPKKKMGTMDRILVLEAVFLVAYTVADLVVFWHTGSEPATLTGCVFGVCGLENGVMGWIKTNLGGTSITTVEEALDVLTRTGVINSPDYWAQAAAPGKVKYLDILLTKAAEKITKAGARTVTPEEGVAALVAAGVINTPDYWLANYGTFPSLGALLCALGGAVK